MAKPKIFISHISTESEMAQILKRHLSSSFLDFLDIFVSSDGKTIQAGGRWLEELSQALGEAQIEIILCSKESVGRPWVNFEAGAGWIRGIQVIPVCHSGMRPHDLPVPLSMLQAVEANQPHGLQSLYEAVARQLEMKVPTADFLALAAEIQELEKRYQQAGQARERIENPRILCAASEQFAQPDLGFDLDIAVLENAFPGRVTVERSLTARRLRDLLTTQRFDILHLVLGADPDTGDLLFSPIDFRTYKSNAVKVDRMSAAGLANLVAESHTRLIVLATCHALPLAVEVSRVTNIIATHTEITGEAAAEWAQIFYDLLAKGYFLFKAFDLTASNSDTPLQLVRQADLAFAPKRRGGLQADLEE